jgi:cell division protein FtsQ
MTMKQIAKRTLMHWKVLMLLIGLGVTGSIAASGLSHLLQDVQIRQVQLQGDLRYLDAESLTRDLSIRFNGNYLETTLGQVISEVESHPWIAAASARRVWPDTLLIEITEQRPVAIYNDTQYLGLSGDLFEPPKPVNEPLPRLYGALSETMQVYSHYGVFSDRLSDFSKVISVSRGHDMGWQITLENGINVQLGRDDILGRLSRARDVLDRLDGEKLAKLQEIDARYDNGIALAWRAAE